MPTIIWEKYLLWLVPSLLKKVYVAEDNSVEIFSSSYSLKTLFLFLKYHQSFKFENLIDLTIVDNLKFFSKFTLYYNLLSTRKNLRASVVLNLTQNSIIPSLVDIFEGFSWLEREAWDMFGIFFEKNCDLRRLLTDYGFSGNPLKKNFPLSGYLEVYYNNINRRVMYKPVKLEQEYRFFELIFPWQP